MSDIDYNYIEIGWWDVLSAPIALIWFFGLTWVVCMTFIQGLLLTKDEVPAQPPFGRFWMAPRRGGPPNNRAP
ncbi:hypothetical protein PRIPAC_85024 [Pristionchus pacificus]|uniref:Uncharacterized protein n=1 Tax=Pristionchus pacificus TaxID=54126 RepID=A0A2A6BKP5_PRIPA|nr:hypothetical protein PRIPAC_85024 [Pristionchus pacificus]|eukprot:PDM66484.1 hypothetical protein PRIPAC_47901 [Pristionchus pacificus]